MFSVANGGAVLLLVRPYMQGAGSTRAQVVTWCYCHDVLAGCFLCSSCTAHMNCYCSSIISKNLTLCALLCKLFTIHPLLTFSLEVLISSGLCRHGHLMTGPLVLVSYFKCEVRVQHLLTPFPVSTFPNSWYGILYFKVLLLTRKLLTSSSWLETGIRRLRISLCGLTFNFPQMLLIDLIV